ALAVRIMRHAISPRLATRIVRKAAITLLFPYLYPSPFPSPSRFPSPLRGGARGGGNPDVCRPAIPPSLTLPHKGGGNHGGHDGAPRHHSFSTFLTHAGGRFSTNARMPSRASPPSAAAKVWEAASSVGPSGSPSAIRTSLLVSATASGAQRSTWLTAAAPLVRRSSPPSATSCTSPTRSASSAPSRRP